MENDRILFELKKSARILSQWPAENKNAALEALASLLLRNADQILHANKQDLENLPIEATAAFRDRLTLNQQRIDAMAESLRQVAKLADPVGEITEERHLPNGLHIRRVRAPLGVIFLIFESRPNVITEAFSLAFKAGNTILLRGGSDSRASAKVIYQLIDKAFQNSGLKPFYGIEDYDHAIVGELLKRPDLIDVVVPRGGAKLIEFVQAHALMPVIKNDRGMCHAYIDDEADLEMATRVVANAKTQRPGVCNALETILVNDRIAREFLPKLYSATIGVQWRGDERTLQILNGLPRVKPAHSSDWDTEHLDMIINCKIVADLPEALDHIEQHGSKHSETIITRNENKARRFQADVDAAAVYWNASTRFTDGFAFGLGGELGISTQKLHVRGPVGLRELTTPRWIIDGTGQIRT